jgi:hypothetical protein
VFGSAAVKLRSTRSGAALAWASPRIVEDFS